MTQTQTNRCTLTNRCTVYSNHIILFELNSIVLDTVDSSVCDSAKCSLHNDGSAQAAVYSAQQQYTPGLVYMAAVYMAALIKTSM